MWVQISRSFFSFFWKKNDQNILSIYFLKIKFKIQHGSLIDVFNNKCRWVQIQILTALRMDCAIKLSTLFWHWHHCYFDGILKKWLVQQGNNLIELRVGLFLHSIKLSCINVLDFSTIISKILLDCMWTLKMTTITGHI